jgi:hypothetical protein
MKGLLVAMAVLQAGWLCAEEFVAPEAPRREIATETEKLEPTIDGIVKQVFDVDKPWQLLNPAAPASYGSGEKNVSRDGKGGTPFAATTLTVFGWEW